MIAELMQTIMQNQNLLGELIECPRLNAADRKLIETQAKKNVSALLKAKGIET